MTPKTAPSTQRFVNVADIREGVIFLRSGGLRSIVETTPLNLVLKSEEDQNALIGAYQNFLNTLQFSIQIVIQSRHLDFFPYLTKMEAVADSIEAELLRLHAQEYIDFLKRLTQLANIMQKRFFIVVPYDPAPIKRLNFLTSFFLRQPQPPITFKSTDFKRWQEQLDQRLVTVEQGLRALGIQTRRLNTQEIIELLYATYNPEEAVEQRLAEVQSLESPIISRSGGITTNTKPTTTTGNTDA